MPRLARSTIMRDYKSLTDLSGDSLQKLADKYHLTLQQLKNILGL